VTAARAARPPSPWDDPWPELVGALVGRLGSYADVARALGVSGQSVAGWARGAHVPRQAVRPRILALIRETGGHPAAKAAPPERRLAFSE